jgi:hypothetical protein
VSPFPSISTGGKESTEPEAVPIAHGLAGLETRAHAHTDLLTKPTRSFKQAELVDGTEPPPGA